MSLALQDIVRIVLLGFAIVYLLVAASARARHFVGRGLALFGAFLLLGSAISFPNFGKFHTPAYGYVHYWDAYHYFMGAKYLPELGYSKLYEASYLAARELNSEQVAEITHLRSLSTYKPMAVQDIDTALVRSQFSDERWNAFKDDLQLFLAQIQQWPRVFLDHGYNDSPPRALLLSALLQNTLATETSLLLLTCIDYLLIVGMILAIAWCFGFRVGVLSATALLLSPFSRFGFVGGSLLRWDWIALLVLGVCGYKLRYSRLAGVCFGYAVLARIFPLLIVAPLAVALISKFVRSKKDSQLQQCVLWLVLSIGIGIGITFVRAPQHALLNEYAAKIELHQKTLFSNQLGLSSLERYWSLPWEENASGQVTLSAAQATSAPTPWAHVIGIVLFCVLLYLSLSEPDLGAMLNGALSIFLLSSPTSYYYSFLVLFFVLPFFSARVHLFDLIKMVALMLMMMSYYLFEITAPDHVVIHFKIGLQMLGFVLLCVLLDCLKRWHRESQQHWIQW